MIRFLRGLIISIIVLAAMVYAVLWFLADRIVPRVESVLTKSFIAGFGPSSSDQYGYKVNLHIWPPTVDITGLHIDSNALNVDGDVFENCHLSVDKITCDLPAILKTQQLKILSVQGRKFSGTLTRDGLARRLERTGGPVSSLSIDQYGLKSRVRGHFGDVSGMEITILGGWAIDDRHVITLVHREYLNPDGPVPEALSRMIEEKVSLDVRVHILDEELTPDTVSFTSDGLTLTAHG